VIVEDSVGGPYYCLTVALGIPCNTDSRLKIVFVRLNSLLQPQRLVGWQSESLRRPELRRELHVIAHAIVEGQIAADPPAILPEKTQRDVVE